MSNQRKKLGTGLEKRVVQKAREKGLDAKVQPLSGVLRDFPSDCVVAGTLLECKVRAVETDAAGQRTFRVDMEWWKKVKENSEAGYNGAALVMNAKYSTAPMVLIDLDFFLDLLKSRKENSEVVQELRAFVAGKTFVKVPEMPVLPEQNPQD